MQLLDTDFKALPEDIKIKNFESVFNYQYSESELFSLFLKYENLRPFINLPPLKKKYEEDLITLMNICFEVVFMKVIQ